MRRPEWQRTAAGRVLAEDERFFPAARFYLTPFDQQMTKDEERLERLAEAKPLDRAGVACSVVSTIEAGAIAFA